MSTTLVPITHIIKDENQPRKYFDIQKMAALKKSIKSHGIVSPLIVEKSKNGYLLIDGERRYRAAVELDMKEVPITILSASDPLTRRVEQFHIQEMHEGWTSMEKAAVIAELTEELKKPFEEVCDMLNVPARTTRKYMALMKLSAKSDFEKANLNMDLGESIVSLTMFTRSLKRSNEETFTVPEAKALEKQVIKQFTDGNFESSTDVIRLKDTFKTDPKTIEKFIEGADADSLYVKSKAKAAYHLRNAVNSAMYLSNHVTMFLQSPDVKLSESDVTRLKRARKYVGELLALAGKED